MQSADTADLRASQQPPLSLSLLFLGYDSNAELRRLILLLAMIQYCDTRTAGLETSTTAACNTMRKGNSCTAVKSTH